METKYKIGIIGMGFLGGTMQRWFIENGIIPYRCTKTSGYGSKEEINRADLVFVCVPSPYDPGKQDICLDFIDDAIKLLDDDKIVILRSTIPPGTTEMFAKKYPQHTFLFNPEFLRAASAWEDFKNPPRQVIGVVDGIVDVERQKYIAHELLQLLPTSPMEAVWPVRQAELLKYASNFLLALRVAAANKIFDLAGSELAAYNNIAYQLAADKRIGDWGFDIFYENFRGYNGTCFPKDIRTLIAYGKKSGVDMRWLERLDDENIALLQSQNMQPNYGWPGGKR